jgi:hypothetical protein
MFSHSRLGHVTTHKKIILSSSRFNPLAGALLGYLLQRSVLFKLALFPDLSGVLLESTAYEGALALPRVRWSGSNRPV